ncbi:hypothetical protein PYCC9005_000904 [Savitreella phatthalungensis]
MSLQSPDTPLDAATDTYDAAAIKRVHYKRLCNEVYLDHAGATQYADAVVTEHAADLTAHLLGNPHSASNSAELTRRRVETIRQQALALFTDAEDTQYDLVFTSGATAAIKLVGSLMCDAYDSVGWRLSYCRDAHTSMIGMRRLASSFDTFLSKPGDDRVGPALVAWSGRSNFSGRRYSPDLYCTDDEDVFTLFDAAALASTSPINLDSNGPDFVCISFYKMFGYPSGLGALLVKRSTRTAKLISRRRYFGGGTVSGLAATSDFAAPHSHDDDKLHASLEDGTLPFHSILALGTAISVHARLFGGTQCFSRIETHVANLSRRCAAELAVLCHTNGRSLVRLLDYESGSPVLTMILQRADGDYVGYSEVERLAKLSGIHIRTGTLCNAGGVEGLLQWSAAEIEANHRAGHRCGDDTDIIDGRPTGAIRVSLGAISTEADVNAWLCFLRAFFTYSTADTRIDTVTRMRAPEKDFSVKRVKITRLSVFPVKSCAAYNIPPDTPWQLTPRGLAHDRSWAIIDLQTGRILTQKTNSRMANIHPTIDLISQSLRLDFGTVSHLVRLDRQENDFEPLSQEAQVCGDRVHLRTYRDRALKDSLSRFLGITCTLAALDNTEFARQPRLDDTSAWSHLGQRQAMVTSSSQLGLSNESPLLCVTRPSIAALRTACQEGDGKSDFDAACFRANIELDSTGNSGDTSLQPFEEDMWQEVRCNASSIALDVLGKCRRCLMINVDPATGIAQCEPYRTLARLRKWHGKLWFGIHMSVAANEGGFIWAGMDLVACRHASTQL